MSLRIPQMPHLLQPGAIPHRYPAVPTSPGLPAVMFSLFFSSDPDRAQTVAMLTQWGWCCHQTSSERLSDSKQVQSAYDSVNLSHYLRRRT